MATRRRICSRKGSDISLGNKQVKVRNKSNAAAREILVSFCSSFFSRFKGLMFHPGLDAYAGILLVEKSESRINAAIHMFFMRFDIAVVWINSKFQVVDVKMARKWRPFYMPAGASRFTLETHADRINDFRIGDILSFDDV